MISGLWEKSVGAAVKKSPAVTLGVLGVCVVAVFIYGIRSLTSGGPSIITPSTYYTTDDGKTLFEDNEPHVAPFDHDGHEAVLAYIIPGRSPGPDSIWYLSKMTDEQKKQLEAMSAGGPGSPPPKVGAGQGEKSPSSFGGQLIKRPGGGEWVPMGDPKTAEILKLPG